MGRLPHQGSCLIDVSTFRFFFPEQTDLLGRERRERERKRESESSEASASSESK